MRDWFSEHNKKDDDTYGPPYFGDSSGPSGDGGPKNPNTPSGPSGGDFGGGSSPNVGNGGGSGGGGGSSSKWYESSFWEGAWTKASTWAGDQWSKSSWIFNRGDEGFSGFSGRDDSFGSKKSPFSEEFERRKELLLSYKPLYIDKGLYGDEERNKDSFGQDNFKWKGRDESNFIKEPSWLYGIGNKEEIKLGFDEIYKFRKSVSDCLDNPGCNDNMDTLMNRAVHGYKTTFANYADMRSAANNEARSYISPSMKMSAFGKYAKPGDWIHPLRNELKYAVSHVSPLVFDLTGEGIKLVPYTKGVYFDIDNDGFAEKVGWLKPGNGHLARDLNKNGQIDDITELFGDDLISAFFKLSLLDSNNDKVIDEKDENFKDLLIWEDKNMNGYSESDELKKLSELGIKSISLATEKDDRVIEGNTITAKSTFSYEDGRKFEVADVHYHNDDMDSWEVHNNGYKDGKANNTDDTRRFRKETFEKLVKYLKYQKDRESDGKKKDWVAKIVKEQTDEYIKYYSDQKAEKIKQELEKANLKHQQKRKESAENCQEGEKDLGEEANNQYKNKKKSIVDELLKDAQKKLNEEKENINARHTQEYLKAKEILLQSINVKLKEANEATYLQVISMQWNQAQYEQAVEANKARFSAEYNTAIDILRDHYTKAATNEIEELRNNYSKEYLEKVEKVEDVLKEKEVSKLNQKIHTHEHKCKVEKKGVQKVLSSEFTKYNNIFKKDAEELINSIKQEANKIYSFFAKKIIERAEKLRAESENKDLDLGEITEWLEDEFFNSEVPEKVTTEEGVTINSENLFMPLIRGYGKIKALHIAMNENQKLEQLVRSFMKLKPAEFSNIHDKIVEILYEWAGVTDIADDSRSAAGGANIEARKVAFIEQMTGQEFKQLGAAKFVGQHASTAVQKAWDIALIRLTKNLLVQGPLIPLFTNSSYSFFDDDTSLGSTLDEILKTAKVFASKYELGYDFWVQLGYILASSRKELNCTVDEIKTKLSELAKEPILLDLEAFSLIGDEKDNIIKGTSGSDYIKGLGGNDKLYGRNGSDHMEGGAGDDEMYGDAGNDRMHGGKGRDRMYGGADRDFMYGDEDDDEIYGEDGDDHIEGGAGADNMDGGAGTNTLSYGSSKTGVYVNLSTKKAKGGDAEGDKFSNFQNIGGSEYNDHLIGDSGPNYINGEGGDDIIEGGDGDDHLFGATGSDQLFGGNGDDTLTGFEGPDYMDGGEGSDTVNYGHPYATEGVIVNLATGKGTGGHAHGDTYKDIENVIGSKFDDEIIGDEKDNILQGGNGDDIIRGGKGDDTIYGGSGKDELFGEDGNDKILLTGDGDFADGGDGEDTISYEFSAKGVVLDMATGTATTNKIYKDKFKNFENATGSEFDDEITGDDKDNVLRGGAGNDILNGGKGNDTLIGGAGADNMDGGEGQDFVDYSASNMAVEVNLAKAQGIGGDAEGDTYKNIENVIGSQFNDKIIGDDEDNVLYGLDGDDILEGGDGDDILVGGAGADLLDGGNGQDRVSYYNSKTRVEVNLAKAEGKGGDAEGDRYISIEGVIGSKYNDKIIGSEVRDFLDGKEGDDEIYGGKGDDIITGGEGNNKLYGEEGDDTFNLELGSNEVDGGSGRNKISYKKYRIQDHEEISHIYSLHINQKLLPSTSNDQFKLNFNQVGVKVDLRAGIASKANGTDNLKNISDIEGSQFSDEIRGNDLDNYIVSFGGGDIVWAGAGNDVIMAGHGNNTLYGEDGDDLFIGSVGADIMDGGNGSDSVTYKHSDAGIRINLETGDCAGGFASGDKLYNIENIEASEHNDTIYDSNADNIINTGSGDDRIYLSDGNDIVNAGSGHDKIFIKGSGNKFLSGGEDSDTFIFDQTFETSGEFGTIISDFAVYDSERIDLSKFKTAFNTLKIREITTSAHNLKVPAPLQNYFNKQTITASVIELSSTQKITLLNVNAKDLSADNFIFDTDGLQTQAEYQVEEVWG